MKLSPLFTDYYLKYKNQLESDTSILINMLILKQLKRQLLTGQPGKSRETQAWRAENPAKQR